MSGSSAWIVAILATSASLASCSFTGAPVPQQKPADRRDSYLARRGGPQTSADLRNDGTELLTRLQSSLEKNARLEQRQQELLTEIGALRSSLRQEHVEKEGERRLRVGAEAAVERLRHIKGDRELKILHLRMQIADLQRTKLQLEIAGIERQIDGLFEANRAVNPPGQGR